jgi:RNA polymerase sigma-70 factor (ECF subfamily)
MSALQYVARCPGMAGRAFAVEKSRSRKLIPVRPPRSASEQPGPATADEDLALMQRAVAGDSEAQTRLFATHTPRLHRMALSVLRNKEDAEDAVQDTWRKAYSKLHTFEARSSISTWLTRIAINSALMIRRRNRRLFEISLQETTNDDEGSVPQPVDDGLTPEESCRQVELRELLTRHINRLPSLTRAAFLLRDVDGFTTTESIKMLGIKKSALKSRVQRARRRLARNMMGLLRYETCKT